MIAKQRQDIIREKIKTQGAVDVSELVKEFGISLETVRKDLLLLEQNGHLKRVHGGAVKLAEMKSYGVLSQRNTEHTLQKKVLSEKAAMFVEDGDVIAVDTGSTAIFFAQVLKEKRKRLTVVTHSKDVFDLLCDCEGFHVILCAGYYLKEENAFYGEFALQTLRQLHVKKAFVFNSAISMKYGLFDFQKELCQVQKEMLHCADEIFILSDSSKFEKTGLLKLSDMLKEYTYITDDALPDELKKMYINNGFRIVC